MFKVFSSEKINKDLSLEFRDKLIYENSKRLMIFLGFVGLSQVLFILFEVFYSLYWDNVIFIVRITLIVFCSLSVGTIYFLSRIKGKRRSMLALSKFTATIQGISILTGCYFVTYMFDSGVYSYSAFYLVIFIVSLTYLGHPYYSVAIMSILFVLTTIYLSMNHKPISSWFGELMISLVILTIICIFTILNYKRTLNDFLQDKELERKISVLASELSEKKKLESIGTLANGIAHEINNPINGILNYSQIILESDPDDKSIKDYAKEIILETERISEIAKILLDFSRQNHLRKEYTTVEAIIKGTLSLTNTIINSDQIILNVNIPKNLPMIKCRIQQIQQVLVSLISNSRDALNELYNGYNENKIININCMQYSENGKKWVKIIVEDFGKGIPKDMMSKIFDPFFSTKGRLNGKGLGLSKSYGTIKEHHGNITVESEEGKFTRFSVILPCDHT